MTFMREREATRATPPATAQPEPRLARRRRHRLYPLRTPYLFVLPFFVLFVPFGAGAVVFALVMAFLNWPLGSAPSFTGVANFQVVGTDPVFGQALWNTAWMLFAYLVLLLPLALAVAVTLNHRGLHARRVWQMVFFLPITGSLVIVSLVFELMYDPHVGFIAGVLHQMGLPAIPFLTNPSLAPWAIIILRLWRVIGYYAVILFAGLQTIPPDLYEAVSIDGGGALAQFRYITMPLLRPSLMFVSVAATVGAWELFAEPQLLTGGGPARATLTAVMYVYQTSFLNFQLGPGAAAAAILALCVIATTILLQRALRSPAL